MKLAWTRLGVPDDWVRWLVGLDVMGTTTVRTPHAINIWNTAGVNGLRSRQRSRTQSTPGSVPSHSSSLDDGLTGEGFHAVRGTGQGAVSYT
ncbi:MAG: hypothetical protein ACK56F_20715, partial [bacterium]